MVTNCYYAQQPAAFLTIFGNDNIAVNIYSLLLLSVHCMAACPVSCLVMGDIKSCLTSQAALSTCLKAYKLILELIGHKLL